MNPAGKRSLLAATIILGLLAGGLLINMIKESPVPTESTSAKTSSHRNRLAAEKSPYLLQHADNPVDWYPWGPEAFEKARMENKPIFLSIGYSTCHWCHVMEHESFEDEQVAKLLNETFVCIKVDREERPDIDQVYMTVCQMMTGSGGWPLTVITTPDKKPFYVGTYFPRESRFGRIGMMDLVPRIKQAWADDPDELLAHARRISDSLQQTVPSSPGQMPDETSLALAYQQLSGIFDRANGGFGNSPKFPTPHNLVFLLHYHKRAPEQNSLKMVEQTLQAMRAGGIYDHIGFGFHRYSTDSRWLVPHFEKMLYDQALLAMAYTQAYQATADARYSQTAREIISYVLRDMTDTGGGFYSAEDADSEGGEGKFYLWTSDEVGDCLTPDEADLVRKVFNISREGNFSEEATGERTGRNILHLTDNLDTFAEDLSISQKELQERLEAARGKLFQYRQKRIHPHKDDKILTDWNGLMIAALAQAGRALDETEYTEAAEKAADFILTNLRRPDGRLLHRYRDGNAGIDAHLDDYAFLTWAMLELYETTFNISYLQTALNLNEDMLEHFWDDATGGLFLTADDAEELLIRQKESYDGAVPSGNSVAMMNLLRLARITSNSDLEAKAALIGSAFAGTLRQTPSAHTQMMLAVDFSVGPSYEVVIVGESQAQDSKAMLQALQQSFIPNKVVVFRPSDAGSPAIDKLAPYTKYHTSINNQATAYVCINYNCKLPVTDTTKMLELLQADSPAKRDTAR